MRWVAQREIEIFGEAIGLEEAFLEAGSALEDPAVAQRIVVRDTSEQPAEGIVFFDCIAGSWNSRASSRISSRSIMVGGQRRGGFSTMKESKDAMP